LIDITMFNLLLMCLIAGSAGAMLQGMLGIGTMAIIPHDNCI